MERKVWISLLAATILTIATRAGAEDGAASPPASPAQSGPTKNPPPPANTAKQAAGKSKSPAKGKAPREKEAEGTEAADRFEANTVIKSKYKLDGESLEVDPD